MAKITIEISDQDYREICGMQFDNKSIMHRVFGAVKDGVNNEIPRINRIPAYIGSDGKNRYGIQEFLEGEIKIAQSKVNYSVLKDTKDRIEELDPVTFDNITKKECIKILADCMQEQIDIMNGSKEEADMEEER